MEFDPALDAIVGAADATGRFENARTVGTLRSGAGGLETSHIGGMEQADETVARDFRPRRKAE